MIIICLYCHYQQLLSDHILPEKTFHINCRLMKFHFILKIYIFIFFLRSHPPCSCDDFRTAPIGGHAFPLKMLHDTRNLVALRRARKYSLWVDKELPKCSYCTIICSSLFFASPRQSLTPKTSVQQPLKYRDNISAQEL